MSRSLIITILLSAWTGAAYGDASVSPMLHFLQQPGAAVGVAKPADNRIPVTIRFVTQPDAGRLAELESMGVRFARGDDGRIRHSARIYPAAIDLTRLDDLAAHPDIARIESSILPAVTSTLNVSNPQVQASLVWNAHIPFGPIDGSGVVIADMDTGIDIYHPAFFKPDGGTFNWLDTNGSGAFESGVDAVDLNGNGTAETNELLAFYDAYFRDPYTPPLMSRTAGVYDADIDWLYNDANRNGVRNYGPASGYGESSPSFGERIFVINDRNGNNRLDPGEELTGLGTSKVKAIYDRTGVYERGINLMQALPDNDNHGTGACGIVGGGTPGRRLVGMAPGVEFIIFNRTGINSALQIFEDGVLWARDYGADAIMYEFGAWVWTPLDGTSNLDTLVEDLYNQGIHQFLAAGNLAGLTRSRHSHFTLTASGMDSLHVTIPGNQQITEVYLSIHWQSETLPPTMRLIHPTYGTFPLDNQGLYQHWGSLFVSYGKDIPDGSDIDRMDIKITPQNTQNTQNTLNGRFSIVFTNQRRQPLEIHAYVADDKTGWMNGAKFEEYLTDSATMCSPGTARAGITVGAYDPRGTRNELGAINDFSSRGPTVDGRRGVDITAPGSVVYSLASYPAMGNAPGGYLDFGGTSSALPHVVGCAALLMQALPHLSPADLETTLYDGTLRDTHTGDVPNDTWGWGKLRIQNTFIMADIITTVADHPAPLPLAVSAPYPNPFNASVSIDVTLDRVTGSTVDCTIYNMLGQTVRTISIPAVQGNSSIRWDGLTGDGVSAGSGLYIIRITHGRQAMAATAMFVR